MSDGELRRRVHFGFRLAPAAAPGRGLVVRGVAAQSCAEAAGVRADDELVSIGEHSLSTMEDAREAQRGVQVGDLVRFAVRRDEQVLQLSGTASPFPKERHAGATLQLEQVRLGDERLRALLLLPDGEPPHPVVYYLPGAHWASEEYPLRLLEPVPALLGGLARAGFASLRVERSGVGDSEGPPCTRVGFERELAGYLEGLHFLKGRREIDPDRIILLGHSVGAMVAPLLTQSVAVQAIITFGASALSIADALIHAGRRYLERQEPDAIARAARLQALSAVVLAMTREGLTPAQIFARTPERAAQVPEHIRGDSAYGRCAAFFQELERRDLASAWSQIQVPVLLLHGSRDFISAAEDSAAIAELVGAHAEMMELPGVDHQMSDRGSEEPPRLAAAVLSEVTTWLQERVSGPASEAG